MLVSTDIPFRFAAPQWRSVAIILCLSATLVVSRVADSRKPDVLAVPLSTINGEIGDWTASEAQTLPALIVSRLRPTSYLSRLYRKRARELGLFIAYYAQQRAGESMHSPNVCLPGNGWSIVGRSSISIELSGRSFPVNQYHVQSGSDHMLVLYWYQSGNRITANEYLGKLLLVRDAIQGGHTSGSVVRIMLPDDDAALVEGPAFASELIPQLERCFRY
jgi:EpsI family protein